MNRSSGTGVKMAARNEVLLEKLGRAQEIRISVTGRKSGRIISLPIWFVLDGKKLYLLPVHGSDTEWYKNVLEKPTVRIEAGKAAAEMNLTGTRDTKQVAEVVEKFRGKYGDSGMKWYSKLDVAVFGEME
jgi:hypothetical protein